MTAAAANENQPWVGSLVDVTGGRPDTVVHYATTFDDEIIAMTTPGGTTGEGTHDVVFDTCRDGRFDVGEASDGECPTQRK